MASHGIWFRSFLLYGILLQVSKGQNATYIIKDWNQYRIKQQTTNEPHLGVFDRVNTTDVPEEFEPITNSSGFIINKPVPGQEMFSDVINAGHVDINDDTSLTQTKTRTTKEPRLATFDYASTMDVRKEIEPGIRPTGVMTNQTVYVQDIQNDTLKLDNGNMSRLIKQGGSKVLDAENRAKPQSMIVTRRRALAVKGKGFKGQVQLYSVIRGNKDNDRTKARNSTTRGVLKEYVVTDGGNVSTKQVPTTVTQNQITADPQLGILNGVNITDSPEKNLPIANKQPQTQTTTESQLGIFDRINTTDVPEEFEPVTNHKGVIINKPVQGQEMYNDILTKEQITINSDKVNDTSLTQTRTIAKPCQEVLDKANVTDSPKEFEPLTNTTRGFTNPPVTGQEMQNFTLTSENENTSRVIKQAVRKVQENESFVKPQNMVVRIVKAFKGKDSKDQIHLYSVIGNDLGNDSIHSRKSRKRGEHASKDKVGGKKVKTNR
ncbi:hypothetical protein ACJMK2_019890 [Sinanodonta woodiana]|uniref:Uncharacterized protein n=1 Tax=Sinanodonta woodiana TaxID=1069815 RepID=A0ABD3TXB0_SINWO